MGRLMGKTSGFWVVVCVVATTGLIVSIAQGTTPAFSAPTSGSATDKSEITVDAQGRLRRLVRAKLIASKLTGRPSDFVASQPGCSNVILNGDFEAGDNGNWIGDTGAVLTQTKPHFGAWGTWFGGIDDAGEAILTSYSIPHFATGTLQSATLRFQWHMESSEGTVGVFDLFAVTANDIADSELDRLEILAQVDNTTRPRDQWRQTTVDMTAHFLLRTNWSSTEIALVDITDSSLPTSWFVDDVVLEICAAGNAPTATATITSAPVASNTPRPTARPTDTEVTPSAGSIFLPLTLDGFLPGTQRGRATRVPPTTVPDPTAVPGGCENVVRNGDFELGENVDWEGNVAGVIGQDKPHFGDWGAWFGGVNDAEEVILTTYTIPHTDSADLASATLRFKWYMDSEEGTVGAYDGFAVISNDEADPNVDRAELLVQIDNLTTPRGTWVDYAGDMTSHFTKRSGWTNSYLALVDVTDGSLITSWYVDDVRLDICTRGAGRVVGLGPFGTNRWSAARLRPTTRAAYLEKARSFAP